MSYIVRQLSNGRQFREYNQDTPYDQWLEDILEFWPITSLVDEYSPAYEYTVAYSEKVEIGIFSPKNRWFFIN